MSHITIVISSGQPPPPHTATASHEAEAASVTVEYQPPDNLTPAQVGQEVTRMVKLIEKIRTGAD